MPWLREQLDVVLFRVSETPITPLTLVLLVVVGLVAALAGPSLRAGLRRALASPEVGPASRGPGHDAQVSRGLAPSGGLGGREAPQHNKSASES